jgi:hypothetical protein
MISSARLASFGHGDIRLVKRRRFCDDVEVVEGQSRAYPPISRVPTEVLEGCELAMSTLVEYTEKFVKLIEASNADDDAAAAEIIRVGNSLESTIVHIRKFHHHCESRVLSDHTRDLLPLPLFSTGSTAAIDYDL